MMNRFQYFLFKNKLPLTAGLLSGVMTGTSYIPFPPWAILFNFVPLWWFWLYRATSRKQILMSGLLAQFVFNLIGFHWVFHTAHEFGRLPLPISLAVLLLFALLAHVYVPLVGLAIFELKKRLKLNDKNLSPLVTYSFLVILCGLWCLAEIYWPYIFQWNMGYTLLWARFPLFHGADIIGFQGLSLILLLFNALVLTFIPSHFSLRHCLRGLSFALLGFLTLNAGSWFYGKAWTENYKPTQTIRFLPVQANIGNTEKIMAERGLGFQDFILDRFISLSEKALSEHPEADVLVWPESAIPDYLDQEYSNRRRPKKIKTFLSQTQKGLITGAYSRESLFSKGFPSSSLEKSYNALFAFDADGTLSSPPYRKHQLLAFGEYTPFAQWFPYLNEISPSGVGFSPGPGPSVIDYSFFKFAPQICYESLYPDLNRHSVLLGAQILINITNDSWFGTGFEPQQHLSMTFARAIENRRPLLRVTNTGITSAIDASGIILTQSPIYQEWSDIITLSYEETPKLTLFTRYGGYLPVFVVLMTLGGLASVLLRRRY